AAYWRAAFPPLNHQPILGLERAGRDGNRGEPIGSWEDCSLREGAFAELLIPSSTSLFFFRSRQRAALTRAVLARLSWPSPLRTKCLSEQSAIEVPNGSSARNRTGAKESGGGALVLEKTVPSGDEHLQRLVDGSCPPALTVSFDELQSFQGRQRSAGLEIDRDVDAILEVWFDELVEIAGRPTLRTGFFPEEEVRQHGLAALLLFRFV